MTLDLVKDQAWKLMVSGVLSLFPLVVIALSPVYTSNFYMAIFMWQVLFARVDDEK